MRREILLVDDDRLILKTLAAVLDEAGYAVRTAATGEKALEAVRVRRPDLVLLDVMMPKMDGLDVCRRLRGRDASLPIVFLTALETPEDEMAALAAGGDVYVSKSTPDALLLARISAVLRPRTDDVPADEERFAFAACQIEARTMSARLPTGEVVRLMERELYLLRLLARHPGEVFTRDMLLTRLWGDVSDPADNTLSVAVYALRKKLGASGEAIKAIRGLGYAYRP